MVGLIQKYQSGAGASAWLCPLQTHRQALSAASSHPQAHAVFGRGQTQNFLPLRGVSFLPVPSKNPGRGRFSEITNFFCTLYNPVLSQSSQYTKSRFGERLA